ncbi:MAG: transcription elongation factor GreA|nr:transcription elongation factor GreA [Candidatus Buchananbacteria bacterium]
MRVPKRRYDSNPQQNFDPYISQKQADQMKADLEKMIKIIRPKLIKEVEEHAKLGDFSENAAYQVAKGKLRGLNNRILVLQNNLNKAVIIKSDNNHETVCLGCKVKVKTNDKQYTYTILGSQETDPQKGIISHLSPIGSALLGHRTGDEVEVKIDDKIIKYKILEII